MATALKSIDSDLKDFIEKVKRGANAQFESPQYKKLLALPLTQERAQVYTLQKTLWTLNRRDCWAFAQALSPMDVKKLIWAHEEDELSGNKERNMGDHYSLQVKSAELIGLTLDDFRNTKMRPETRTCLYAWVHLAKDSPWMKSVAASIALEVSNSSEWVNGGGMSYRMGKRFEQDLKVPFEKNINAKEHAEVDVEHAHMLLQIARRHATSRADLDLLLEGLRESWELERVWKGLLHDMMAELPGPRG
jgi:pyrroloquinoline quinone (PQQ) biosynthesis protein C